MTALTKAVLRSVAAIIKAVAEAHDDETIQATLNECAKLLLEIAADKQG